MISGSFFKNRIGAKSAKKLHYFGVIFFLLLIASLLTITQMRSNAIIIGSDQLFHISRIHELSVDISRGQIFPTNGFNSFGGIGVAVNSFYPYLLLYPFAIANLFLSPVHAYFVCMWMIISFSLILSYFCARIFLNHQSGAFAFSVLYNVSQYMIFQYTFRGDVGELCALTLVPLIFLATVKLFESGRLWLLLPLGMAGISYSHFLSVFIFGLLILVYLCTRINDWQAQLFKRLLISVLIYLVIVSPMIFMMLWARSGVELYLPDLSVPLQSAALSISEFMTTSANNSVPVGRSIGIGLPLIVAMLLGLARFKSINKNGRTLLLIGLLFLALSTQLFPWMLFQNTFLSAIQLPWRFLGPAMFCFAVVGAEMIGDSNIPGLWTALTTVLVVIISVTSIISFVSGEHRAINNDNIQQVYKGTRYTDYMPKKALAYSTAIYNRIALVNGKPQQITRQNWKVGANQVSIKLTHLSRGKIYRVDLPVLYYGYFNHDYHKSGRGTIETKFKAIKNNAVISVPINRGNPNVMLTIIAVVCFTITVVTTLLPTRKLKELSKS